MLLYYGMNQNFNEFTSMPIRRTKGGERIMSKYHIMKTERTAHNQIVVSVMCWRGGNDAGILQFTLDELPNLDKDLQDYIKENTKDIQEGRWHYRGK